MLLRSIRIIFITFFVLLVGACSNGNETESLDGNSEGINIVAAENFYGEVAKTIGGDKVNVISILNNSMMDPEDYTPTPENAKDITNANIVIYNGLGYDNWMNKLLSASKQVNRQELAVATDVLNQQQGDNPHVWYNIEVMPMLANRISDMLSDMDPQNAAYYQANTKEYKKKFNPLVEKVNSLTQSSALPIETTETVFDYMAESLNLTPQTPGFSLAIFNGVDPAPADLIQIENNIKEQQAELLIYNPKTEGQGVQRIVELAKEADVPVVSVTEQKPDAKSYIEWMMDQLNQLEEAINDGS